MRDGKGGGEQKGSGKGREGSSWIFVVNRFFMKLFRTSDTSVIVYCREMFQFDLLF